MPACTLEGADRGPDVQLEGDVSVGGERERAVPDPDARRRHQGGSADDERIGDPDVDPGVEGHDGRRVGRDDADGRARADLGGREREPAAERREADAGEQDDPWIRQVDAEGRRAERAVAEADRAAHRGAGVGRRQLELEDPRPLVGQGRRARRGRLEAVAGRRAAAGPVLDLQAAQHHRAKRHPVGREVQRVDHQTAPVVRDELGGGADVAEGFGELDADGDPHPAVRQAHVDVAA
jgi:hypothetical protein